MNIHPSLGGGKFGDPSLYIDIVDRRRGLLFDCGLNKFGHASLRKVSHLFISHTHIDHFIGFDLLLRMNLSERKTLHIYGPPGIQHNVRGKLQGYTWNICQNLELTIVIHEILPDLLIVTELESSSAFAVKSVQEYEHSGLLVDTGEWSVQYAPLDHKTPSFGYAFRESDQFNVQKDALHELGLAPGPWIATLKTLAFSDSDGKTPLLVGDTLYTVGFLAEKLLVRKRGIKITYLTDCIFDEASVHAITRLAWKSDLLFCESAFLERDRERAKRSYHLTAREAGLLAHKAQVHHLVLFHVSRRYQEYSLLLEEARQEFPSVE